MNADEILDQTLGNQEENLPAELVIAIAHHIIIRVEKKNLTTLEYLTLLNEHYKTWIPILKELGLTDRYRKSLSILNSLAQAGF